MQIGIIALLLFMSMMIILIPRPVEAGPLTVVQASINEGFQEVDVSPGARGSITYTGKVEVINYNTATPLIVTLSASSEVGVATLDKPSMVFQGNKQSDTFQIVVTVDLYTTRQTRAVRVTGFWNQGATTGNVGEGQAQIQVQQFERLTVFSELPVIETGPGTQAVFSLRVENTGNFEDEVRIEVPNIEDLTDKGYIVPLLPKSQILVGEPKIFTLPVTLPHDWVLWTDHPETIWIKVTSISSGEIYSEDYPLIIRVRGIYIPGFEPVFAIMCIAFLAVVLKKRHDKSG
jgi:hypothetical protein